MLKIAVVEDEQEYREKIVQYINDYMAETGSEAEITPFKDGSEILAGPTNGYDIIFLDIEMPDMNGMDTAHEIRKSNGETVIVFITYMAQYAIKGYEVDALDFILKPINYFTFTKRFARAIDRIDRHRSKKITLSSQDFIVTLDTEEIYYVESSNRFLHYHLRDKTYSVRGTMKGVEDELSPYNFVRCNHWYLVNLEHVSNISNSTVTLGEFELEISRRNKAAFREAFTRFIQGGK